MVILVTVLIGILIAWLSYGVSLSIKIHGRIRRLDDRDSVGSLAKKREAEK